MSPAMDASNGYAHEPVVLRRDVYRQMFALSLRVARKASGLTRETVIYEMTSLGDQVSLSTLARWETSGVIKAEDAWYLSRVYDITLDELLLSWQKPGWITEHQDWEEASDESSDRAGRPSASPESFAEGGALAEEQKPVTRRRRRSKRQNLDPDGEAQ